MWWKKGMQFSLRTGRTGFDLRQGEKHFILANVSWQALEPTTPHIQSVPGGSFPEGKVGRGGGADADQSPPFRAEVRAIPPFSSSKHFHGV